MKGLINELYFSPGIVKKIFGVRSTFKAIPPLVCYNLYLILNFEFNFYFPLSRKTRSEKEVEAKKRLPTLGIKTPRVFSFEDKAVEMEYIKGENLYHFFTRRGKDEVYRMAMTKGRQTKKVHQRGFAFLDNAPHNTVIKDGELYCLDHEFFVENADSKQKKADIITFIAGIRNLEPELFKIIKEGFERGYGEKISIFDEFFSKVYSIFRLLYERDLTSQKLLNVFYNTWGR